MLKDDVTPSVIQDVNITTAIDVMCLANKERERWGGTL